MLREYDFFLNLSQNHNPFPICQYHTGRGLIRTTWERHTRSSLRGLAGQLGCGEIFLAQCTICKAKVAEFCGACVRAAVEAPRDSREDDRGEQVHILGTWVLRARPRGVRAWMTQLTALIPVLCEETRKVHCTATEQFGFIVFLSRRSSFMRPLQLFSTGLVDDRT